MAADLDKGINLFKNKQYKLALSAFRSLEEEPSENLELSYYLGLCFTKLGIYEEALLYLEQVVTTHSNLLVIYQSRMILSYIYTVTGRLRLAAFELDQLIESGFESAQVFATYGFVQYSLSNIEESLACFQKAITIDADNANALNSMGYIMAEEEIDTQGALSYCKNAVKLNPVNPSYLDSLGWAFYKCGNFPEARNYLRKAMDLSHGNKVIALHMRKLMEKLKK